jgi:hypothetical protein
MRRVLGILLILSAVCLGLFGAYLGIWVFLVGGISTVIDQLQADRIDGSTMAWAIVRIVLFELPFGLCAALAMFVGGFGGMLAFDK